MTLAQKEILKILSCIISDSDYKPDNVSDWNDVLNEAKAQGIFLLIYEKAKHNIETYLLHDDMQKWNKTEKQIIMYNLLNLSQNNRLHYLLSDNNIPYTIIKGQASASFYPNPILRIAGDIDFLIEPSDVERTKDILINHSYTANSKNTSLCHLDFRKKGEMLEMHWEPNGIPDGEKGDFCRTFLSDTISTSVLIENENSKCFIPDRFHHGLIILLHTAHHMINTGIGLRHLCDWAMFVNHISNEEFVELFKEKLNRIGLWRFAQIMTQICMHYLCCEYKQWADDETDKEYLERIMADIMESGNLGKKDSERINDAKLMTIHSQGNITDKNMIVHFFNVLIDKARNELPICKKVPLLFPFGLIYLLFRHIYRVLQGNRPQIHVKKMLISSKERRDIYRRFNLFE